MTLVNDPLHSRDAVSQYVNKAPRYNEKRERKKFNAMATVADNFCNMSHDKSNKVVSKVEVSSMCNENHDIEDCTYYLQQTMEERSKFLFINKLCYGYLKPVTKKHNAKICSNRRSCKVCNGKYVTTLHGYLRKKTTINSDKGLTDDRKNQEGMKCASVNAGTDVISMCVVPIKVQHGNSGEVLETHALLDSCSQGTFILETLINNLGVKGQKTSIIIKTLNGEVTNKAMVVKGLKVTCGNDDSYDWLELPDTYTKKYLPADKEDVATPSKLKQWNHLESIVGKINQKEDISVGLLIGENCAKALEPIDIMPSKNDGPYVFKTKLAWCIVGPVNGTSRKEIC